MGADSLPDRCETAILRAQLAAVVDEACEIHEDPHPMFSFRDYLLHRLGTYGHAHDVWNVKEAIEKMDGLEAENARLKHVQQWRAVGVDSAEDGVDAEFQPWRGDLERARDDVGILLAENDPPFDEVFIETRWLSKPERCAASDEKPNGGPCGRLLVGQGDDTYDPLCVLPKGHEGTCKPEDENAA